MSTDDEIKRLCSAERLFPFVTEPPIDDGAHFLMSFEVNQALENGLARGHVRWEKAAFDLTQYCERGTVTVRRLRFDRDADVPAFFVYLEPRDAEPSEIWEVRFTDFRPQIRMFGSFYGPDCFVALTWNDRDHVVYPDAMRECATAWEEIFGLAKFPYRGAFPYGYLSKAQLVP